MRLLWASVAGEWWGGSRVVVSTACSGGVTTQTSALLPPRCIEAMSPWAVAMRAMPPGSTRQERGPSDTANTRRMTERGTMRSSPSTDCQVGIWDSGR